MRAQSGAMSRCRRRRCARVRRCRLCRHAMVARAHVLRVQAKTHDTMRADKKEALRCRCTQKILRCALRQRAVWLRA